MKEKFLQKISEFFKEKPLLKKVSMILLWLMGGLLALFIVLYIVVYFTIPSENQLKKVQNFTASEIYSEDKVLLGKYYVQERTNVPYEKLSPGLINALIATEDVRFYQHHGVDYRGMGRVFVKSILMQNESAGGGSTISQQLAKNLFPRKKFWLFSLPMNKLREMMIAKRLEQVFTKEQILALYLNTVPFGENAFGIATASRRFFKTSPDSLKVQDAALLIGMLKATTAYNPKRNLERSKARRNVVLGQMAKYGYLTIEKCDSLKELPVKLKYNFSSHNEGLATYFREELRQELSQLLAEHLDENGEPYNLYTDGLKIYTTINSRMQMYAEQSVKQHMAELQKSFYDHWGKKNPWGNVPDVVTKAMLRSERYISMKEAGESEDSIKKSFKTPVEMKIFSYKGEETRTMTPLDSINYYLKFLQPGFMVMETGTGKIKAWVGGIDYRYFKYDHVNIRSKRQVGSTFKPIVYTAALQQGVKPCEYISNEKMTYEEYENWSPRNADEKYGGMYSMQGGLTNSVNTISAQVIMKAGIPNVVSLAKDMGIESPLDPVPSLALGTADISLFEMVVAYSVFANRGVYVKPTMISKITDSEGKVIYDSKKSHSRKRVLSANVADMMIQMLGNVVNRGTAARLRYKYGLTGDLAGKTGTTQQHADGWFVGFTPKLIAGAWVGGEDRRIHFRSLDMGQGAAMALPIWGIFMNKIYKDPRFKSYKQATFTRANETDTLQLSCADYIPPDTIQEDSTGHWWWPFDKDKEQEEEIDNENPSDGQPPNRETKLHRLRNIFRRKR